MQGIKTVENRGWATRYRGPLLVHASKKVDPFECAGAHYFISGRPISLPVDWMMDGDGNDKTGYDWADSLPGGGIIGVVDLVDCVRAPVDPADELWWDDMSFAWILRNARPLPFHAVKGSLGLWECSYTLPCHDTCCCPTCCPEGIAP